MDCPACGSSLTLEVGPKRPLSTSLPDAILVADEDERIEVTWDCWDCGWQEARQIRVESIDTTAGDETAVERAALVDEITDDLVVIEDLATLEEIRTEIRCRRRHDPATTDTGEGSSERTEMSDDDALYDVRERTKNPEHASVDDVVELLLERAKHPRAEHQDAHLDEMMATVVDKYGTNPVRTVIHRVLVDHYPFRTATHDFEMRNVDGIRIGTTAGQFLAELNAQDDA